MDGIVIMVLVVIMIVVDDGLGLHLLGYNRTGTKNYEDRKRGVKGICPAGGKLGLVLLSRRSDFFCSLCVNEWC